MKGTPDIRCTACGHIPAEVPTTRLCPECGAMYPEFELRPLCCEGCGYDLTGFAPSDKCSECGRAVAESFPANRPGLPIQRDFDPGPIAWLRTLGLVLFTPRRAFEQARCVPTERFWHYSITAAAFIPTFIAPLLDVFLFGFDMRELPTALIYCPLLCLLMTFVLNIIAILIAETCNALCDIFCTSLPKHARFTINALAAAAWVPVGVATTFIIVFAIDDDVLITVLGAGVVGQVTLYAIGARTMRHRNHPAAMLATTEQRTS